MGEFNYLNLYEIHNLKLSKCPSNKIYDIDEIMKFSKNKITEADKKSSNKRLKLILQNKCCISLNIKDRKHK